MNPPLVGRTLLVRRKNVSLNLSLSLSLSQVHLPGLSATLLATIRVRTSTYERKDFTASIARAKAQGGRVPLGCYGVLAEQPNDVGEPWTTSLDPQDPIFYSTCYVLAEERGFTGPTCGNACKAKGFVQDASWRFSDRCISCETLASTSKLESTKVPHWILSAGACVNCAMVGSMKEAAAREEDGGGAGGFFNVTAMDDGNVTRPATTFHFFGD